MVRIGDGGDVSSDSELTAERSSPREITTVQIGEGSLDQVAQRLGVAADTLHQANPQLSDPTRVLPGQELNLPATRDLPQAGSGAGPGVAEGPPAPLNDARTQKLELAMGAQCMRSRLESTLHDMAGGGPGFPNQPGGLIGGGSGPGLPGQSEGLGFPGSDRLGSLGASGGLVAPDGKELGLPGESGGLIGSGGSSGGSLVSGGTGAGGVAAGGGGFVGTAKALVTGGVQAGDWNIGVGWKGKTDNQFDGSVEGNQARELGGRDKLTDMGGKFAADGSLKGHGGSQGAGGDFPAGSDAFGQQPGLGDNAPSIGGFRLSTGASLDANPLPGTGGAAFDVSIFTGGSTDTDGTDASSDTGGTEGTDETDDTDSTEETDETEGSDETEGTDDTDGVDGGDDESGGEGQDVDGADTGRRSVPDDNQYLYAQATRTRRTIPNRDPLGDPMNTVGGGGGAAWSGAVLGGEHAVVGEQADGVLQTPSDQLIGTERVDRGGKKKDGEEIGPIIRQPQYIDPIG